MAMDLSRMSSLTDPERWLVASDLQAMFLDEVYVQTGWSGRDGVFHGGTALHLAWNSPRYSEDLDFMVVEDRLARLAELAPRIVDGVRMRILEGLPGSVVEFKARDRTFEGERVVTWDVRWKHENRQGKVQIKLEFLAARPERLADYASFKEMRLPGLDRVALRAEIPVPEKVAFWGDKVKAFATRPEVKWRDVFDLGFLSRQFERDRARPSSEELAHALEVSARIYNREACSLVDGLRLRLGDGTFVSSADYISGMAQWFDPDTYRNLAANGTLEEFFGRARTEVECGLELAMQAGTPSMRLGGR
jgi:hypothetical protein